MIIYTHVLYVRFDLHDSLHTCTIGISPNWIPEIGKPYDLEEDHRDGNGPNE